MLGCAGASLKEIFHWSIKMTNNNVNDNILRDIIHSEF